MQITVNELRRATDVLLTHLEATGRSTIQVEHDYYWSIDAEQRHDVYKQPVELSIGQLSADLSELRAIANGEREAVGYGLVWLASVLRAAGEEIVG